MPSRADNEDIAPPASRLIHFAALFHKAEIAYVLAMLFIATWGLLRADHDMINFTVVWAVVCVAAAVVALWPGAPRALTLFAEALLLAVAIGQWIGPKYDLWPMLGREISDMEKWNELPLTQRRIVSWNLIAACFMFWAVLPYAVWHFDPRTTLPGQPMTVRLMIFIPIWMALAFILVSVLRLILW